MAVGEGYGVELCVARANGYLSRRATMLNKYAKARYINAL